MTKALEFRRVASAQVAPVASSPPWRLRLLGRSWSVWRCAARTPALDRPFDFTVVWRATAWHVTLAEADLQRILADYLGPIEVSAVQPALRLAMLHDAFARADAGIDIELRAGGPAATQPDPISLHCESDDGSIHIRLACDGAAALPLLERLPSQPQSLTPALHRWGALPVPVTLEWGSLQLSAGALRSLRPGDVLLPAHCWSDTTTSRLLLAFGGRLAILTQLTADKRSIAQTGVVNMQDESLEPLVPPAHATRPGLPPDLPGEDAVAGEARASAQAEPDWGGLLVRLSFDLGQRMMSLGELVGIKPGHVWDLGLNKQFPVQLRVNGTVVGDGELVEIDGRLGVCVRQFFAPQCPPA